MDYYDMYRLEKISNHKEKHDNKKRRFVKFNWTRRTKIS